MHSHAVQRAKVRVEDGLSLVGRKTVVSDQELSLAEEAGSHLPVTIHVKEELLDLVETHAHANLPRMHALVKALAPWRPVRLARRLALGYPGGTPTSREGHMRRWLLALSTTVLVVVVLAGIRPVGAQSFYEGKTVRIIVGLAPGGGFDTYARVIARHIGRHVPGNPAFIVENMTGAGSLIAANHVYKVAKPDGLTIGKFNGSLMLGQVLGQAGIEFDARKFEFIGAAVKEDVVCSLTKASGITSLEKWAASKTPVKLGGIALGASPDNSGRVLKAALGLPVQVVSGYRGTAEIRLAVDSGELAGACWSWESMRATWRAALDAGEVIPVLQVTGRPFPDLPSVPLAVNLAKSDEARRLIEIGLQNSGAFARPFVLPPGTPKDRVRILRRALQETLKDPAFVAEAEKARLTADPVTGEDLEKMVAELFALDADLLAKLKNILLN
jgi:tripartite-type tricarboxylate transporter receptor subunit TctC